MESIFFWFEYFNFNLLSFILSTHIINKNRQLIEFIFNHIIQIWFFILTFNFWLVNRLPNLFIDSRDQLIFMKFVQNKENNAALYFIALWNFKNRHQNKLFVTNFAFKNFFSRYFYWCIFFFILANFSC